MSGNISLLTALFIVCYFIGKGRNAVVFTTLTRGRDRDGDYFTNVCSDCHKYGASTEGDKYCKCKPPGSVFLRYEKRCQSENDFHSLEGSQCLLWSTSPGSAGGFVRVVDTEKTDSQYVFLKTIAYTTCQVEPSISYRSSTTGKWEVFNLTGDVLEVQNDTKPMSFFATLKVTQQSPNLTMFKGYIMKLGLECITRHESRSVQNCLLFKAKGKLHFPLTCNLPSTTSLATTTPIVTVTPSTTVTTVTTVTPTSTPTGISTTTSQPPNNDWIIAAIVTIGTVLCLFLICAFVFVLYRYTHICKARGRQRGNGGNDFNVIGNPGPQIYRIQEEPVYAEVTDIFPTDNGNTCDSTKKKEEERPSVLLNPYLMEATFSTRGRPPLPSRPETEESVRTRSDAAPVYQNGGHEAVDQETDGSIVFTNREIEETSFTTSPSSENDSNKLSESHEQDKESIAHDHQHEYHSDTVCPDSAEGNEEDLVYQGLVKGKRAQSVFVCPSCNDNTLYQRLSTPRNCPHGEKEKTKEKRASFYESLAGLEKGSRESVYACPSRIAEESAIEDEENVNSEEGEGLPEYQTLEPEESVSNQDPDEPVNHDYNVLEEPETACDEVDERINDRIHDVDPTSEDPGLLLDEPSRFANIEDNPAYVKPLDAKEDLDLNLESSEILNIEDNPANAKPWDTKEDSDLNLEPSEFLNIEDNPAYAKPWNTKTVEPSVRKRAYSM